MDRPGVMDFEEIRRVLPQAYPFLMVDRVVELEPSKRIVAIKNVTGNESFFQGHFPEIAIMPAALVLEGLAQATILLTSRSAKGAPPPSGVPLFGAVHARMSRPVFPGDVLRLEVRLVKEFGDGGAAEGEASVDGAMCVQVEMYFSRVKKEDLLRRREGR